MPALAVSDWTTTVGTSRIYGRKKEISLTLVIGDGVKTYPSGGIPMPVYSTCGLKRNIDDILFVDTANANGYVYKYDKTNHKLRIYQTATLTPAGTVAAPTFTGSALSGHTHTSVQIDATATAGDISAFVGLLDGGGSAVSGTTIGHAGGAGADISVTSSSNSAGTPAGSNSAPAFTGTATTAAALAEVSGAIAALTLKVFVFGW
jgi:hypothetical protein